jgi:hypothetical protein
MGLNDMVGRVQDAIIGRFLSADSTIPDPADPESYNRYSYTVNNPLTYTDPSGFAPCSIGVVAGCDAPDLPPITIPGQNEDPIIPDCIECLYNPGTPGVPNNWPDWPGVPFTYPPANPTTPAQPARPPGVIPRTSGGPDIPGASQTQQQSNPPTVAPLQQVTVNGVRPLTMATVITLTWDFTRVGVGALGGAVATALLYAGLACGDTPCKGSNTMSARTPKPSGAPSSRTGQSNPPPGSRPIDQTDWSGDHGQIKGALGLGGADNVVISPNGDVWAQNPDGSWTNAGPAGNYTGSGQPSGRTGGDRDGGP